LLRYNIVFPDNPSFHLQSFLKVHHTFRVESKHLLFMIESINSKRVNKACKFLIRRKFVQI